MPNKIANKKEWIVAKTILETIRQKGQLHSGFKVDLKKHKQLKHSFIYLLDDKNNEILVSLSRYYFFGKGIEGKVKLVEDEEGNLFALKMGKGLAAIKARGKTNEEKILKHLGYLHFYGVTDKHEYLLQKFHPGITLEKYIHLCTLSDEQKYAFAYLLVKAMQYLHHQNVIHGDVKCNNYIINVTSDEQTITAVDFGHSDLFSDFEEAKKYISDDISRLGALLQSLGCENEFTKNLASGGNYSLDDLVKQLEKYSSIKIPIPNLAKQLIENYEYMLTHEKDRIKSDGTDFIRDCLHHIVRTTNDISTLNELFKFIKEKEKMLPLLRKKTYSNRSEINAWKQAIDIFKTRAMQIALDNINLGIPITHPEHYYNILAENGFAHWISPTSRLYKFEKLLNNKKTLVNFDESCFHRAKLIKYFENYIDRIESYPKKDHDSISNFTYGFWFNKENRGIRRKAKYDLACAFRNKLSKS